MGRNTTITGEFKLSEPIASTLIDKLSEQLEVSLYFFRLDFIESLKVRNGTPKSSILSCRDNWKNFDAEDLTKFGKDFINTLNSYGIDAIGRFECLEEEGDHFGVHIQGRTLSTLIGKVVYEVQEQFVLTPGTTAAWKSKS